MPTYQYRCQVCGVEKELVQKISERQAPDCCDQKMESVLSATSFILKGTGWAKDGYTGSK